MSDSFLETSLKQSQKERKYVNLLKKFIFSGFLNEVHMTPLFKELRDSRKRYPSRL